MGRRSKAKHRLMHGRARTGEIGVEIKGLSQRTKKVPPVLYESTPARMEQAAEMAILRTILSPEALVCTCERSS